MAEPEPKPPSEGGNEVTNGFESPSYSSQHRKGGGSSSIEDGDDDDITWTLRRVIAVAALCFVYVGSQAILYFVSPSLSYIAKDIDTTIPDWLITANTLAVAAICPFVGYLTDLLGLYTDIPISKGRRLIAIFGSVCLIVSCIVVATTRSLASAIVGMAIGGIGAGICELTALAGVAEITPVRWRGVTLAIVTFTIMPFNPDVLFVQLLYVHSTWRWGLCICGIWNFIGFLGLVLAYKPPSRHNVDGLSNSQIAKRIDWVGGFLTIGGTTLFLAALQAGGYQHPWTSAKVLGPLIAGVLMLAAFVPWEYWGCQYPMVPGAIFKGQSVVAIGFAAVFLAGMNFYAILGFFPLMLNSLYPPDAILVGIRCLSYPFAITGGACLVSALITYTRGNVREMFAFAAVLMATAGALAASTPFNPSVALAFTTISSFGIGAIIVPALTLVLYACPDEYIGTTAALSLSVRFLGGAIGTTIYYNIFHNKITTKLPTYVASAATKAGLPSQSLKKFVATFDTLGPGAAAKLPDATPSVLAAAALASRWAYADSLRYVWYTTIPFSVLCIICCACLPNISRYMTDRIAVDIH